MKKLLKNILLIASVLLIAASCEKSPTGKNNLSGIPILLTATEFRETKALLDAESFNTMYNRIRIYDYYTDGSTSSFYIDDSIKCNGSSWPFISGKDGTGKYEWTTSGIHRFYGWLLKDSSNIPEITSKQFFKSNIGTSFLTNRILTIPTTTLTQTETPQFDFMYSNIETRDLNTNPNFGPVEMEFKHLFTAFKVTAANNSSNEVQLKSVEITGLKNSRSATISYAGDGPEPVINYPISSSSGKFSYTSSAAIPLGKTVRELDEGRYIIMWPHSKADFENAEITVNYDYKEPNATSWNTEGQTKIKMADLTEWKAGEKNTLGLMFKDKEIKLTCIVEPWNVVEENIDFTDQISVSKPIVWEENTVEHVDYNTGEVILYSDDEIEAVCNFHIDTPSGATWTASLIPVEGYSDAFEIVGGTKYGAVGVDSQIRIKVTNKAPIAPRHAVKLRITIQTADGRTIIADLVPKNTQNENIKEFTIIQNLING